MLDKVKIKYLADLMVDEVINCSHSGQYDIIFDPYELDEYCTKLGVDSLDFDDVSKAVDYILSDDILSGMLLEPPDLRIEENDTIVVDFTFGTIFCKNCDDYGCEEDEKDGEQVFEKYQEMLKREKAYPYEIHSLLHIFQDAIGKNLMVFEVDDKYYDRCIFQDGNIYNRPHADIVFDRFLYLKAIQEVEEKNNAHFLSVKNSEKSVVSNGTVLSPKEYIEQGGKTTSDKEAKEAGKPEKGEVK